MVTLGIIFLIIIAGTLIAFYIVNTEEFFLVFIGLILGLSVAFSMLLLFVGTESPKTEFKYPITEYTLEYEVITRGEQVDSTYVITKLE